MENHYIQTKAEALYDKWIELKHIRTNQGYTSTNIKLAVRKYGEHTSRPELDFYV